MYRVFVILLLGGFLTPAQADVVPWWRFDSVLEEVRDRGVLRVGVVVSRPYAFCRDDGPDGYGVAFARQLGADMGVKVDFVLIHLPSALSEIVAGHIDLMILGVSPRRAMRVNYSQPIIRQELVMVRREDTAAVMLEDFNQSQVQLGVLAGSSAVDWTARFFPDAQLLPYMTNADVVAALAAGELDGAAANRQRAQLWVQENPTLQIVEPPFSGSVLGASVQKGDLDTLNFINSWIAARSADGTFAELEAQWFGDPAQWAENLTADSARVTDCFD